MNDFARLELEAMARARAALEPAPEDHARNRRALTAKIAAAEALAAVPAAVAPQPPTWRGIARAHWFALGSGASTIAAIAFCAGYWVGQQTSTVVVKTVSVVAPSSAPSAAASAAGSEHTHGSSRDQPQPTASSLALTDSGRGGTRTRVSASATPSASAAGDSLTLELDLLQRAEHTIRAGEPQLALGLLRELDAKFPKGQLMQERTAARVLANCQLDETEDAQQRGRTYLSAHPRSVYANRVRTLCRLEPSQPATGSRVTGD